MNDLEFYEIDMNNKESIMDLINFYTKIYLVNFSNDDERESLENLLIYLRNNKNEDIYKYHIVIEKYKNKIIGGAIFDYYIKNNCGVIEYLTVDEQYQSQSYGSLLYDYVCIILNRDAYKYNKCKCEYIFCEIEIFDDNFMGNTNYLYFWNKYKYKRINIHYIQPPLSKDKNSTTHLWFIVKSQVTEITYISSKLVKDVIYNYFKYSMRIDNPNDIKEFRHIEKELNNTDRVKVNNIL